jgi:hypothetical protein
MNEGWSRGQRAAIVAVAALGGTVLWLVGDKTAENLALILLSVGTAAAVAWLSASRPGVAFGILFLVATLSRWTISTHLGDMRLEQPAIVAGFAALLVAPSRLDLGRLRALWPIGASFGLYLACLTLSSVLFAPDRADSLRMTFWTGLSMAGGLLAFLLLARSNARATEWMLASGYVQAAVALVFAVLFFTLGPVVVAGPEPAPGIIQPLSSLPKVFGLSWEANLYASLLAALAIIGLNRLLSGGRPADKVLVPFMVAAIALGVTRGAYLGLAAGVAVYALFAVAPERWPALRDIRRVGKRLVPVAGSLLVGMAVAAVLLQGGRPPNTPLTFTFPGWGGGPVAVASGSPGPTAGPTARPTARPTPSPTPKATPFVVLPQNDTVAFRAERIPVALADIPNSLVIGLGANSFGQRHEDPSQHGAPDHIAPMALAALYESGVLGAAGLGLGFGLILLMLFRSSRRRVDRGTIAAYAGALASLLVAYEATSALNFALIWLIAGAGLAAATQPADPADPAEGVGAPLPA